MEVLQNTDFCLLKKGPDFIVNIPFNEFWTNFSFSPLQKRQILVTLVEIFLPLLFSGILIVLRQKVPFKNYPNATTYESFAVDSLPKPFLQSFQLAYVPFNSSVVRQVAEDVRDSLSLSSGEW